MNTVQASFAVLDALRELDEQSLGAEIPCSMIYVAIGMDIHAWERIRAKLVGTGLCAATEETIKFTDKGRAFAQTVNAILKG
jgi:predicted transcriptional regulator